MALRLFVILSLVFATQANAELYKWVDKNGVLNYTDSPPPAANPVEKLSDRVSVYQPDPVTKAAAAQRGPSYYEGQLEREWSQRQASMARAQLASESMYDMDPRFAGYATPYGPAVFAARPLRPIGARPARPFRSSRPLTR